ncbi:hypothetical protein FAIPA1_150027 [Frankia sp. AiPs1]
MHYHPQWTNPVSTYTFYTYLETWGFRSREKHPHRVKVLVAG